MRSVAAHADPARWSMTPGNHTQVDSATDALMQATIRTAFATSTVITVAHRLSTLRASDVIVVLSAGAVVEVGAPQDLLADPQSAFSTLHRGGSNSAGGSVQ